jgi:hypothetical protein
MVHLAAYRHGIKFAERRGTHIIVSPICTLPFEIYVLMISESLLHSRNVDFVFRKKLKFIKDFLPICFHAFVMTLGSFRLIYLYLYLYLCK